MSHLFVDISSHGFGHLAQAAPILNALRQKLPDLRLTIRSGLPIEKLNNRIHGAFEHIHGSSDFGFAMINAVSIDHATSSARYRAQHADWDKTVAEEASLLGQLSPDLVLTDVAYLPLAGAAKAGIPSLSMCSLNWADLFAHFYGNEPWAAPIHAQMLAAYRSAECFLRLTPAMPMPSFPKAEAVAPVASLGTKRRTALCEKLACATDERIVLVAFGGIDHDLAMHDWPILPGMRWLVPHSWGIERPDMVALEPLDFAFTDLLASVDAVLTKPGYGTFVEAALHGTAVMYQRREDWPEQECLIDWLRIHARCHEIGPDELADGHLKDVLAALWATPPVPVPHAGGIAEVAAQLVRHLTGD